MPIEDPNGIYHMEQILADNADKYQALADKAEQDVQQLLPRLDEILNLKEVIRAQAAEIDRLNRENNVLTQELTRSTVECNQAIHQAQLSQLQVSSFQEKNGKLLEIISLLKANGGRVDDMFVASFDFPAVTPMHGAGKKGQIGLLGRMERIKADSRGPRYVCACEKDPSGVNTTAAEAEIMDDCYSVLPADVRNRPYEARISALQTERDAMMKLYSARISELQASLERVRATLGERAEKAEYALDATTKELLRTMRKAGDLEARVLHLESNLAGMAARGALAAQQVREEADQAIRDARREMKLVQYRSTRTIKRATEKARQTVVIDTTQLKERIRQLETENEELENRLALTLDRLSRCEQKLRSTTEENSLVRSSLRSLYASTKQTSSTERRSGSEATDLLSICAGPRQSR
ncbi:hypothetical protein GMRT_14241 [Giardia muris]|uniref:Uncharacterized protein n=1 Tax=Giardia muris TaxID=5742 RepID=A0A4Z1T3J7_GIAMU|nr:hypothetical protein GMRT_14241 [Giardia muris]|eukprot:TNJ30218.1 hypothetical protein GMRT_14241 [Giardia muris]